MCITLKSCRQASHQPSLQTEEMEHNQNKQTSDTNENSAVRD